MELKTIQWNIGGGKLLTEGNDPTLLASYREDGLPTIITLLKKHNPDIITLQETHASDGYCQPQLIAEALGYKYWVNDEWAESHIEPGQRLGQAIVCRHPIDKHDFAWFKNPHFKVVWEDGTTAMSHDKGRTSCNITLPNGQTFSLQTAHTIPFRRFKVSPSSNAARPVLENMSKLLATSGMGVLQADFNIDSESLRKYFSDLFASGFEEVIQTEPTTPKGRHYDHVLYKGMRLIDSSTVSDVLTDHYPIITTFKLASATL